jgi:hypothetical protein
MVNKAIKDALSEWSDADSGEEEDAAIQKALAAAKDEGDLGSIAETIENAIGGQGGLNLARPMHLIYLRAVELGIEL